MPVWLVLLFAAWVTAGCASAGTPGPTNPPGGTATQSSARPAASTTAGPTASTSGATVLEQLAGGWSVAASNPRLIVAPGKWSGATATMEGARFEAHAKVARPDEDPVDWEWLTTDPLVGRVTLVCSSTRCHRPGVNDEIRLESGALVYFLRTGERYGTANECSLPDLPGRGEMTVTRRTTIRGAEVPSEMRMTGGASSWTTEGQGGECLDDNSQAAWDLTWTRLP